MTIYTSLPERFLRPVGGTDFGGVYQRACIDSWAQAGFRIVSINPVEEVEALRKRAYPVEFAVLPSRRPTMNDFLKVIRTSDAPLAGIINADCLLVHLSQTLSEICHQAQAGMVILERLNISPATMRPSGKTCYGFDAFFFETRTLHNLVCKEELCIGQYWWDYWLPLAYAAEGAKLISPSVPILLHLDHGTEVGVRFAGQFDRWMENGHRMLHDLLARFLPPELEALLGEFRGNRCLSEEELHVLAERCFMWLKSQSAPALVREGEWEDLILRFLRGLSNLPERALCQKISHLNALLTESSTKMTALEMELHAAQLRIQATGGHAVKTEDVSEGEVEVSS
jgi:hypothetical protein